MTGQALGTGLVERLAPFATLPDWLTAVSDSGAVRAAIERHVPEFASGDLELRECKVTRVRLKRESQTATCRLRYAVRGAGEDQEIELLGNIVSPGAPEPEPAPGGAPFAAEGWRWYLPELRLELGLAPTEQALPAVSPLTDPEQSRQLLETAIRSESYPDARVVAAHPKVARAKASRTTVLYELEYSPADPRLPSPVIAKTYRGDKGANAYRGMRDLWRSKLGTSRVVAVAEPLAFIPDLNVLLQGPVRGADTTLKGLIRSGFASGEQRALDQISDYVDKTAAGLAELHTSGVTSGDQVTWVDRVADVKETVGRAAALSPQIEDAAAALLTRVGQAAAEHPADAPAPTHGSFRPNQVLLHDGEIGFIDFDRFCQAEPGLDVASFLAAMKDAGRPDPDAGEPERAARFEELDALEDRFVARYRQAAPLSAERASLWQTIELFNAVLDCWTKMEAGLEARLGLLVHHLRRTGLSA